VHTRFDESIRDRLAKEAVAGDRAALVRLIELMQPDIRRFARTQCQANDVEDAVQEALWLLYRRVGMLRAAAALTAWLVTVVRRECLRLARLTFRHEISRTAFDESRLAKHSPAELRLDVAAAIDSLPPQYREIVVLRDFEQLRIDEIGAALELSREAVKGRLHRARALLREYLLDY
jgi:RNA polymerase sigma-70 factor (ECF subfamily)